MKFYFTIVEEIIFFFGGNKNGIRKQQVENEMRE